MKDLSLFILIASLWILALFLFKKLKLNFFKFLGGSLGIFTISLFFFLPYLEKNLNFLISQLLFFIGKYTNLFTVYVNNSMLSVEAGNGVVSILINYECSGVIEMLVFTSLALFFPFGGIVRKITSIVIGNIYIFAANIIRILFIASAIKIFGVDSFNIVHSLLARILFFVLMIILYYFVFTATHLRYQSVGEIE